MARTRGVQYEHQEDSDQTVRIWGDTADPATGSCARQVLLVQCSFDRNQYFIGLLCRQHRSVASLRRRSSYGCFRIHLNGLRFT
jgi:hypothetical protein